MTLEYHTRNKAGKYNKEQDVTNIAFQEDGRYCYMTIEKVDGMKKRYLLKEI